MSEPTVLFVKEVAKDLRCREAFVWQLIREGKLGAINVGGAHGTRVPVASLNAYKSDCFSLVTKCNNGREPKDRDGMRSDAIGRGRRK